MEFYVGSVVIDVNDLDTMVSFWKQALRYDEAYRRGDEWAKLVDPGERGVTVSLQKVPEERREKNRLHLDLYATDHEHELERLVKLGASVVREPEPDEDFIVLEDPEGNLFCIIDKDATG